jgi:hypothetical protein
MNTFSCIALIFLATIGCTAPFADDEAAIGRSSRGQNVVDEYDRSFEFDAPEACTMFVRRRMVDETRWVAAFEVEMPRPITIVYRLAPGDELPVRAMATTPRGEAIVELRMSPTKLTVSGANGDVLAVDDYLTAARPVAAGESTLHEAVPDALKAMRCLLPAQTLLGAVPAFVLNRSTQRLDNGVATRTADAPPIVVWRDDVSILGALWIAATGLSAGSSLAWTPSCGTRATQSIMGEAVVRCAP